MPKLKLKPFLGWLLAVCTVVGGLAAIWYFRQEISQWLDPRPPALTRADLPEIKREVAEETVGMLREYLDGLPQLEDAESEALFTEGRRLFRQKQYAEALDAFRRLLAKELTTSQRAALHILIGNALFTAGSPAEALGHYQDALRFADAADDEQARSGALGNMGIVYMSQGELDKALEHHQRALAIDTEIGYRQGEASNLCNMGNVYEEMGKLDEALACLQEALGIFEQAGLAPLAQKAREAIQRVKRKLDEAK